jgi:DNA-binding response OmpR family regulator
MRNKGVDYVLINMDCPKLNGREMLKIIRSEPSFSRLRVYGMSNVSRSEAGVPLGPDGCDDWFLKPVNREVFLAAITTRSAG